MRWEGGGEKNGSGQAGGGMGAGKEVKNVLQCLYALSLAENHTRQPILIVVLSIGTICGSHGFVGSAKCCQEKQTSESKPSETL